MKCFVHLEKEAIAACRHCGKGMCEDCSAYSGHSGICPECRLKGFKEELMQKDAELKSLNSSFVWEIVKAVLLCWLIIPIFIGIYRCVNMKKTMETLENRILNLTREIRRLEEVLRKRGGAAFY